MPKKKKVNKKKLVPLKIEAKCVATKPTLLKNIVSSMERDMPEAVPTLLNHDGQVVLVGSGVTVKNYVENIRAHQKNRQPIVAIKGAYDWLMEEGIVPDACVMVDPQANQTRYFKHLNKHTKFLIASQCHPKLFDHFDGYNAIRWHCFANCGEQEALSKFPGKHVLVTGGTTSGLRAICLTFMLGFQKYHLYGFDSCSNTGVCGNVSKEKMIPVYVNDENGKPREFMTTPAMAKQAEEFPFLFNLLPGFICHIYGDGLIRAVVDEIKRKEMRKENEDIVSTGGGPSTGLKPVPVDPPKPRTRTKRTRVGKARRS